MTTLRWQETPEWRKAIDKRGFYPIDVENAARVAVAADRRQLRTQVEAISTGMVRHPQSGEWVEMTAEDMRADVLGLLGGDE